jgi:hypothetical protein
VHQKNLINSSSGSSKCRTANQAVDYVPFACFLSEFILQLLLRAPRKLREHKGEVCPALLQPLVKAPRFLSGSDERKESGAVESKN